MKFRKDEKGNLILDENGLFNSDGKLLDVATEPEPLPTTVKADGVDNRTPMQKVTEELKSILPSLISAKDLLKGVPKNESAIRDLTAQLKSIEGNISEMGHKIVKIGDREIKVHTSKATQEQRFDFAKYLINVMFRISKVNWFIVFYPQN